MQTTGENALVLFLTIHVLKKDRIFIIRSALEKTNNIDDRTEQRPIESD